MRLVVVGGVAGGMSAAAGARRLSEDPEIIVLESRGEVSFANCGLPCFVSGEIEDKDQLLVQTPEGLRASLGVDVRINTGVVALNTDRRVITLMDLDGHRSSATTSSSFRRALPPSDRRFLDWNRRACTLCAQCQTRLA